jgi:hypothetical protein
MKQPYVVLNQQEKYSEKNGTRYYEITMVGAVDRCEYHTYIDPSMRNYRYWVRVIDSPKNGFVIRGCNVKKNNLISADSRISIVWQTEDPEDVLNDLWDIWQEQDKETANHN